MLSVPTRQRPAEERDEEFLRRLFAESRESEFARLPLDSTQIGQLLRQQFDARARACAAGFPAARWFIVESLDEAIGTLCLERSDSGLAVQDIAILSTWQNRGVGSALLRAVLAEARAAGLPVQLQVRVGSAADRLYRRLGFVEISNDRLNIAMQWRANSDRVAAPRSWAAQPDATAGVPIH